MQLLRRVHEWGAERFRFIQFPRPQFRGQLVGKPTLIDKTLKWMIFAGLMLLIWGGVTFWTALVSLFLIA